MKCNKRVYLIEPNDLQFETKCENLKVEILKVYDQWKKENKNVEFSNLSHEEHEGLKELQKKIENNEIVVKHTDKSKRFAVETPESYSASMKPHIENKTEVDEKFVTKTINKINEINKSLVKILGIGKESNQEKRATNNVFTFLQTELPVLNGLPKDHKTGNTKRPVVNGNVGPVANSSNITSDVLEVFLVELREKVEKDNTCKSSEELICKFIEYNKKVVNKELENKERFVASLDVKALYPSLKTEQCVLEVKEAIKTSEIKLDGINKKELGVFLRKNLSTTEIVDRDFEELVPTKVKNKKVNKAEKSDDEYALWSFKKEYLSDKNSYEQSYI